MKTTITIYNSVNSEYVREATDRLNTKIQEYEQERETEQGIDDDLSDEEIERQIRELKDCKNANAEEKKKILRCNLKRLACYCNIISIVIYL